MFRVLIVALMLGLVTGCGIFGAKAPTGREVAASTFDGVTAAVIWLDANLTSYVVDNPELSDAQRQKVTECSEKLERSLKYLEEASAYFNRHQENQPGFKQNLGLAAKILKLALEDAQELGLTPPTEMVTLVNLAIAYSGV